MVQSKIKTNCADTVQQQNIAKLKLIEGRQDVWKVSKKFEEKEPLRTQALKMTE